MRNGFFAAVFYNCHFFPILWVSPYISRYGEFVLDRISVNDSAVFSCDMVVFQLLGNKTVSLIILAYNQSAAGILVDSVDDTRSHDTVNTGQPVSAMSHNRVYQRAVRMAGGRMDSQAFWFIHNQYVLILIED